MPRPLPRAGGGASEERITLRAVAVDVEISAARNVITAELDEKRGVTLIDGAVHARSQQL